jgi:hypothetical protein
MLTPIILAGWARVHDEQVLYRYDEEGAAYVAAPAVFDGHYLVYRDGAALSGANGPLALLGEQLAWGRWPSLGRSASSRTPAACRPTETSRAASGRTHQTNPLRYPAQPPHPRSPLCPLQSMARLSVVVGGRGAS